MGKRGPKPTPTAQLRLRGSWRGNARKNEPTPTLTAPAAPSGLDNIAKAEWKRVVDVLVDNGLMTELDRTALEAYCVYYSQWRRMRTQLSKRRIGTTEHRRVWSCVSDAYQNMMRAAALFGMSPADRARVSITPADDEADPMEAYLGKKHG